MAYEALYERREQPWQSVTPDSKQLVQIAFNKSGIPFWRAKKWFETDKAFTQWVPLAKCLSVDDAFKDACRRLAKSEAA